MNSSDGQKIKCLKSAVIFATSEVLRTGEKVVCVERSVRQEKSEAAVAC